LTRFDRRGGGGGNNHALHDQCPRPYPEDQGPNPARKVPPNLPGHNGGPLTKAAYFTDMDGAQGAYFVVNVDEPTEMAHRTESLLQGLGAEIQIQFVWTAEDVQEAMPAFEQAAQKYG
jgi:hypothetical protein